MTRLTTYAGPFLKVLYWDSLEQGRATKVGMLLDPYVQLVFTY